MSVKFDAKKIATFQIYSEGTKVQLGQSEHRIGIAQRCEIGEGERVLEIGCGQGDMTTVLAVAVGETGHVTAIDPAPLDYGSPFNLGQAQGYISASPVGKRITFVQADPIEFLENLKKNEDKTRYSTAIFAHSIWYFAAPSVLAAMLRLISEVADRICIAEYALSSSIPTSAPHVLASLACAALECRVPSSRANIRTVLSPDQIKAIARDAGLTVEKEDVKAPPSGMFDGMWEVGLVRGDNFLAEIEEHIVDEREKAVVVAVRDAVIRGREQVVAAGQKVSTMDVWVAIFRMTSL